MGLNHMAILFLIFWRNFILFSIVATPFYILTISAQEFQFLPIMACYFGFIFIDHPNRYEVVSPYGFDLYFPDD